MNNAFSVNFDDAAGLMTLSFVARDRALSTDIVTLYMDGLREQLRKSEIESATEQIASLKFEAETVNDPLLRDDLYLSIAQESERLRMAEVSADISFKVVQHPFASPIPYRPRVLFDCLLTILLTPCFLTVAVFTQHRMKVLRQEFRALEVTAAVDVAYDGSSDHRNAAGQTSNRDEQGSVDSP